MADAAIKDPYTECKNALLKLKKNREMVPKKELLTKYAAPYAALKKKINELSTFLVKRECFFGFKFMDMQSKMEFLEKSQHILDEDSSKQVFKEIGKVLSLEYDLDKALKIAEEKLFPRILKEAYVPYWRKCCIVTENGVQNIIVDAYWNEEKQIWEGAKNVWLAEMLPYTTVDASV